MHTTIEEGYTPPPEFQEDAKDPLVKLGLTEATELWLIQWPINQPPDFDGQEVSLKLNHDGQLGTFKGSSGKEYDVVSFAAQEPDATVFLSSGPESKIVGKISRCVSLVHYPDPEELQKLSSDNLRQMYQKSSGVSLTTSHYSASGMRGANMRNMPSMSGRVTSTHSSRQRSSLSEVGEPSKPLKRRRAEESPRSMDRHTQDSGRGHSAVTSSDSLEHSQQGKPNKKKLK
ncbi:mediator-associated protein 2 [Malania oleifera]|uniref:mediator-associated protein 2 n=1 Tax=Malania oleifera TaxID=397392 RepID=UPI0025ADF7AA|nr:mediator-associated protein 2 [Malania oleifera]XP_057970486.1 mediator-associated protein 2 [Malania oleifera]